MGKRQPITENPHAAIEERNMLREELEQAQQDLAEAMVERDAAVERASGLEIEVGELRSEVDEQKDEIKGLEDACEEVEGKLGWAEEAQEKEEQWVSEVRSMLDHWGYHKESLPQPIQRQMEKIDWLKAMADR